MNDFLIHYGVPGQKKGVRKYQDETGKLTEEGRRHYGIGERREKGSVAFAKIKKRVGESVSKATNSFKLRTKNKVSEMRGPQHMSDAELSERVKRMRTESEYMRLKREIEGGGNQNNGGDKKDKKHPLLNKAVALPVATAIGVGVAAVAKEKVSAFLDHRAATKMSTFMKATKTSTSTDKLSKLFETARRAADSAGHPVQGVPNIKSFVQANKDRKIASLVVKNTGQVSDFIKRTSLDTPILNRRMRRFNTYL